MDMVLCEPIRELYKDEVRSLAEYLDVSVSQRQPFPGPGLAVRVMGEATPKRADGLTKVFEWYLGPMVYSIKKREEETSVCCC